MRKVYAERFALLPRDASGGTDTAAVQTLIRDGQGRMESTGKIVAGLNVPAGSRSVFEAAPRMMLQPARSRDAAASQPQILVKKGLGFCMTTLPMPDPEPGFIRLALRLEMTSTQGAETKECRIASPGKPGPDGSEQAPTLAPTRVAKILRLRYGETTVAAILPDADRAETVCVLVTARHWESKREPLGDEARIEDAEGQNGRHP